MPQGEQTVDDREIIEFMQSDPDPVYTTQELASVFKMTENGIRGRLSQLHDGGRIRRKKPSSRTVIWWVDEDHGEEAFSV